jgi:phosphate-selective porin OprO/OprP
MNLARVCCVSLSIAILLAAVSPAHAKAPVVSQQPKNDATAFAAQAARLDALEARLSRIEQLLGASQPTGSTVANDDTSTLDQRLRILERQHELQQEDAAAKTATAPVISVSDKGLSARSASGDYEIKLRGAVQLDQRTFIGDKAIPTNNSFLFRLVRPTIEGQLGQLVAFRITPEFAGDSATLRDAYVDLRLNPAYTVRAGKFASPVGLEKLQSSTALDMMERGLPSELAPDRDIGVQLQGELAAGRVNYAAGVFNGAPDGRDSPTSNPDNTFEFDGRVFFEPWKNDANALSGLGFGIGGSIGDKQGSGVNFLPRYRTPGQNVFFSYRSAVAAAGRHERISPQAWYYHNAFGLLGEYIRSSQEVVLPNNPASRIDLTNRAWQLTGSWVLTGEDASYKGVVKPTHPFVANGDGWGALELVGRYGELDIDDDAFPLYADPGSAARRTRAWGLGLSWYLTSNLKLMFNHTHASFDGGAPHGGDREDEKTFFSRVQVSY